MKKKEAPGECGPESEGISNLRALGAVRNGSTIDQAGRKW
jgi:hypothetical protein